MLKYINNNKGFSLIHLIVVMFILGILLLVTVPRYMNQAGTTQPADRESVHQDALELKETVDDKIKSDLEMIEEGGY